MVLFGLFSLAQDAHAQWSVSATGVGGGAFAIFGASMQSMPVPTGPLAPGTIASVTQSAVWSTTSWSPAVAAAVGPVAFEIVSTSTVSASSGPGPAYAVGTATVDFLLTGPGPGSHSGVLVLEGMGAALTSTAGYSVDVNADGTQELSGFDTDAFVPVTIPPAGLLVRAIVSTTAGLPFGGVFSGTGTARIQGEFFPGHTVVDRYDSFLTLVSLDATPLGNDRWALNVSSPVVNATPLVTVFGFQPMHLPLAPGLMQLVTVDTVLLGGSFVLDLPLLPPGFELFAQGVVVDANGAWLSSNSVRASWF